MRARMALRIAGIDYQTVEISLRDKPSHMLRASPKGTVPVLCLVDGRVIDQSLDIMLWALQHHDPQGLLLGLGDEQAMDLLNRNDSSFKVALDQYKYASRFPEKSPIEARQAAMTALLEPLASRLRGQPFIGGERAVIQDLAIFPFVRQFAGVEPQWFEATVSPDVIAWLAYWLDSPIFQSIMQKNVAS